MNEQIKQLILAAARDIEPFDKHNHIYLIGVEEGMAQVGLDIHPESLNRWGMPHGGLLFTLCDVASGIAVLTVRPESCVTLNGAIDFIAAGPSQGKLIATGRTKKVGGKTAFCEAEIHDETGKLIASGHSVMYFTGGELL